MTLAVVVLLLLCALGTWFVWRAARAVEQATSLTPKEEETDLGSVVTRVRSLSRLETSSMHVVNVSTIKQSYDFVPNALSGDEITFFAAGDVIAGIDLSAIQQRDVWRESDGTLVMRLPPPQILVSRIDNRESHVIARRTGVFRRADQGLEGRARQYAEQQIRREAMQRNILGQAQEGAEAKLAPLLHTLGFAKVRFERGQGGPMGRIGRIGPIGPIAPPYLSYSSYRSYSSYPENAFATATACFSAADLLSVSSYSAAGSES